MGQLCTTQSLKLSQGEKTAQEDGFPWASFLRKPPFRGGMPHAAIPVCPTAPSGPDGPVLLHVVSRENWVSVQPQGMANVRFAIYIDPRPGLNLAMSLN